MKELILMTAAYRIDNLVQSFDSIEENFKNNRDVHVTWLLCYDQYNAFGDIEKVKKLCQKGWAEYGMGWLIYNTGKPNQKNFGGDMYNEPLKFIKENWFKNEDPWVYIFDDDNVIHPALAKNFEYITNVCEEKNKDIIWLGMNRSDGTIGISFEIASYAYHRFSDGTQQALYQLPDPSQLLMKFSTIEQMGFYDTTFEYDRKMWNYIETNIQKVLFADEWIKDFKGIIPSQCQSYHNGQITFNGIIKDADNKKDKTYSLVLQGNDVDKNCGLGQRFPLPKYIGEECFRKLRNHVKEKKYIPDDRIFKKIDKIYILTLCDTPERWDFVIKQFKEFGIYEEVQDKIELVKGVKLPFMKEDAINVLVENGFPINAFHGVTKTQNVGLLNCGIEHYRIMKKALSEGYETVMIIEDDACFTKNLELLKKCIETMPENFTVLHLEGYLYYPEEEKRIEKMQYLSRTPEEAKWESFDKFKMWDTACIIYSRRGMENYTNAQDSFFAVVDWRCGSIVEDAYFYNYPIVIQEDTKVFNSSISNVFLNRNSNLYLTYINIDDYFNSKEI